ncbi:MAG: NBR1-Ig-like domain-containing protein [Anaerolineae bacterium]|jgi:hypothetical protein
MKEYRPLISTVGIALAFVLSIISCIPSQTAAEVTIVGPADGSTVYLGNTIPIRVVVNEPKGIGWIELQVDGQLVKQEPPPQTVPVTELTQNISWTPEVAGRHSVRVVVRNNAGEAIASDPITLYGVQQSAAVQATVIAAQLATATPNPFAVPTPLPTSPYTPPPPYTPVPSPCYPSYPSYPCYPCYDSAAFVADVTVPDCSQLEPGTSFNKTWRLRNTGTCTWDTSYQLVFVGGLQLNAPNAVSLQQIVSPGYTVDITVPMVAPNAAGTYRSQWQMRNPGGRNFGPVIYALIQVCPSPGNLPAITRFEVVPSVISQGQSATIYWEYVNGTSARLVPGGEEGVGPSGTLVVSPAATTNYQLVVSNAAGSVEQTITLFVQTAPFPSPPPPPPASPANLAITAVRADGFDFTWTDTSSDEQGFYLYNADTQQILETFGPNVTGGVVSGLTCGTPYRFYLTAFNAAGESWPSNTVQATTNPCDG